MLSSRIARMIKKRNYIYISSFCPQIEWSVSYLTCQLCRKQYRISNFQWEDYLNIKQRSLQYYFLKQKIL